MNPTGVAVSSEHYEALRQWAVDRCRVFPSDPLGAILVVKAGVAGWMRQWQQAVGEITAVPSGPRAAPPERAGLAA
jgi:hypothetical protein